MNRILAWKYTVNDFLHVKAHPYNDLYDVNELTILEGIRTGSNFDKSDYIRCKRYCEEDFDICEERARRSGLRIFGIVMLIGIGIAVYTKRASILLGALFVGFLFGIMNYGIDSRYCKVILERELIKM